MKSIVRTAFILMLSIVCGAPVAGAAEKKNDEERQVVKRIFVRDGEVIEIDGDAKGWNGELLPLLGNRTFLGVHVIDVTEALRTHYLAPEDRGVLVSAVSENTPAAKAGIRVGDVILSIDGEPVTSAGKLGRLVREHEKGDSVEIEVVRSGARQKLYATLEEREASMPRIHIPREGHAFQYRLDNSEESLKKLQEYFGSEEWKTRVGQLPDCSEMKAKIEAMQSRLNELEKVLEKMKRRD